MLKQSTEKLTSKRTASRATSSLISTASATERLELILQMLAKKQPVFASKARAPEKNPETDHSWRAPSDALPSWGSIAQEHRIENEGVKRRTFRDRTDDRKKVDMGVE